MHRFVVNEINEDLVQLPPDEAAHAIRVLRLKVDDEVRLSDGAGRNFRACVEQIEGKAVYARILEAVDSLESPARITLYQGLPKAEKLEWIWQKATELGAARLVPVHMTRSVAKWGQGDTERKLQRLERIAMEAVKQCGRAAIPSIAPVMDFKGAMDDMRGRALIVMPWEEARGTHLKDVYAAHPDVRDIGILIGPEGGIDEAEAEAVCALGGAAVTLGPRILRCETAAISSIAMAQQLWGDL